MQVCTSLQTDKHANTSPLSFYGPDTLPAAHQQRQSTEGNQSIIYLSQATLPMAFIEHK